MHTTTESSAGTADLLARRHSRALLARANALTRRPADAWDLLQDTLERALTRIPATLPPDKVRAWLYAIMQNLYLDRCRAQARRKYVPLDDDTLICAPEEHAEADGWQALGLDVIRRCVNELDPRLRGAYELCVEQGLSLSSAAAHLGVPSPTVGTRVHRARKRLRILLEQRVPTRGAAETSVRPRPSVQYEKA